jgi:hypothetical protein
MTATLAAKAFARAEAVEGVAFAQATEVFCDLGRAADARRAGSGFPLRLGLLSLPSRRDGGSGHG